MAIDQNSPDRISGVTLVRQDKETSSIMSFPENGKLHNILTKLERVPFWLAEPEPVMESKPDHLLSGAVETLY
jgi:hypothetical protein